MLSFLVDDDTGGDNSLFFLYTLTLTINSTMIITTSSAMTAMISIVDEPFPALPCPGIKVIVAFSKEVVLIDAVVMKLDGDSITGGSEVVYDVAIEDMVETAM